MKVQRILCPINEKGQWEEPEGKIRFVRYVKSEMTQDIDGQKSTMKVEFAEYIIPVKEDAIPTIPKDKQ
jgi:hypothetical protein